MNYLVPHFFVYVSLLHVKVCALYLKLSPYLSVLDFLKSLFHKIDFELDFELDFLSIWNLIFASYTGSKNQCEIQILENQVQIDRRCVYVITDLEIQHTGAGGPGLGKTIITRRHPAAAATLNFQNQGKTAVLPVLTGMAPLTQCSGQDCCH